MNSMSTHDVETDPFRALDNRLAFLDQRMQSLQVLAVKHSSEHVYLMVAVTLIFVIAVAQIFLMLAIVR
jgi:hypothetical protein